MNMDSSGSAQLIAVVDDDASVRKALKRLLHSAGFDVETFAFGDEFLASISQRMPDCLVLDIRMPRRSGIEIQSEVVALGKRLPVIFITAHDDPATRAQAFACGASGYFQKPVGADELLGAIHQAIRH